MSEAQRGDSTYFLQTGPKGRSCSRGPALGPLTCVASSGPLGGRCCRVRTRGQRGFWASSVFLGLLGSARCSQGIVCGVGFGARGGEGCALVPELSRTRGWCSTCPNTPAPTRGARGVSCPSASLSSTPCGPGRAHRRGGPVFPAWRLGRAPRTPRRWGRAALRLLFPRHRRGGGERGAYPSTLPSSGKDISREPTETHPSCSIPAVPGVWGLLSLGSGTVRARHA